jgi:hypothetical protein
VQPASKKRRYVAGWPAFIGIANWSIQRCRMNVREEPHGKAPTNRGHF